jgi:two-component system, LuxR family, response regulator FixJ
MLMSESPPERHSTDIVQPIVYVVDDDDAVRDSLKVLLESYDLTVRDFGSVPDFLDAVDSNGAACLVLDLHLPVMGGFDVMNTLGQRGSRLPVIVITGRGDAQTKTRALQAGATAFLEKPVDHRSLMAAIQTALQAHTRARAAQRPGRGRP